MGFVQCLKTDCQHYNTAFFNNCSYWSTSDMQEKCKDVVMNDIEHKVPICHMLKLPQSFRDINNDSSNMVLCGNYDLIDFGTKNRNDVTCKKCIELLSNGVHKVCTDSV